MKRQRTPAQRRAAQRLARLGQSLRPRAAGDAPRRPRPPRDSFTPRDSFAPRDSFTPRDPRLEAQFAGFGPSATGWEKLLPDFELPVGEWELKGGLPNIMPGDSE